MKELEVKELYTLSETLAAPLLESVTYPWEALAKIGAFILELGAGLSEEEYENGGKHLDCPLCQGSAYRFHHRTLYHRQGYGSPPLRVHPRKCPGGRRAVVGNSTELKNVILFNKVQVPHYNYVGDSILGYKAHMGAGSITSNVKSDKLLVKVHTPEGDIETGIKKFGAMIGDEVEVGCGSVLNPGTVIGKNSNIYPLSSVRGVVPAHSIYKKQGEVAEKR